MPDKEVRITSPGPQAGAVKSVELLGSNEKLRWSATPTGLVIQPPAAWPCQHAVTFKITPVPHAP